MSSDGRGAAAVAERSGAAASAGTPLPGACARLPPTGRALAKLAVGAPNRVVEMGAQIQL